MELLGSLERLKLELVEHVGELMRTAAAVILVAVFGVVASAQETSILPDEPDLGKWSAPEPETKDKFKWGSATAESMRFLTIQHGIRLTQTKTYDELHGPFFNDYIESVKGLKGWRDGDSAFTNYVGHPMQGAVTGYIQVQNDPHGKGVSITDGGAYWKSRVRAMGWSALYSTQFELGPYSEASIGNVGQRPGTMGYVDLVMTPTGGFGMMVIEDLLDEFVVARLEGRSRPALMRTMRMVFSPNRTLANILRFKKPWRRDNRDYNRRYAVDPPTPQRTEDD